MASANGDTRSTGSPGHEQSADYVIAKLTATGYYNVSSQPFTTTVFTELAPPTLAATPSPPPAPAAPPPPPRPRSRPGSSAATAGRGRAGVAAASGVRRSRSSTSPSRRRPP